MISAFKEVYEDLKEALLYEETIRKGLGYLANNGALIVDTTPYTGRSPKDKFVVRDENTENLVWWGDLNQPFDPDRFERLKEKVINYLSEREVYVENLFVGNHPNYKLGVRVITESPWHALFARNMFIRPKKEELRDFQPFIKIYHAPFLKAKPEEDGTRSEVFIILNLTKGEIIIGGTPYAGEIKKSVFTFLNYYYPLNGVLSMHCGANMGKEGDVALFFGLSGTGKTSLSTDPERPLIGDDEHGWAEDGVFNFEGGCYAKVIRINPEKEEGIYKASTRFGTILENVVFDPYTREVDFDSAEKTENTRSSYPINFLDNIVPEGRGGHPKNIFFLALDAYGVLPPIAKLEPEQIRTYFLAGYTSKIAGTERGINEPQPTFSACFGAPFLPLNPKVYANMLVEKVKEHNVNVWLVNTGWIEGPYGVGHRIDINYTRRLISAALKGEIREFVRDEIFGFLIPKRVDGIPDKILMPINGWNDRDRYI
ncbi:MAG: phosphoenolpyruvate carboxykinase (ATP) [candidate division WOR-3 bacterium]